MYVQILLRRSGVVSKLKKLNFCTRSVNYVRYVIRRRYLEISCDTSHPMPDLEHCKTVAELKLFHRLCNRLRRFVPNLAHVEGPLNRKLIQEQPIRTGHMTQEEATAMKDLNEKIISQPVPDVPGNGGMRIMDADALNVTVVFFLQ